MSAFATNLSQHNSLSGSVLSFLHRIVETLQQTDLFSFQTVRLLFIALYFPSIQHHPEVLFPLLRFFSSPQPYVRYTFEQWFASLPRLMGIVVGLCRHEIETFSYNKRIGPQPEMFWLFAAMKTLYEANDLAEHRLPITDFYWQRANEKLHPPRELTKNQKFWHDFPFLLSIRRKAEFCELQSIAMMELALEAAILEGFHEAISSGNREILINPWFTLHVSRNSLVEDAVRELRSRPIWHYQKKLRVFFDGEDALDLGGPTREFMYFFSEKLTSPEMGLFKIVENKHFWFCTSRIGDPSMALVFGAIVGLAIHNSIVLPVRFPLVLYKKLQMPSRPLTLTDLSEIDGQAATSLRHIEGMLYRREDVRELGLTFSITVEKQNGFETIDLIPNGAAINVTLENCQDYLHEYINFMLFTNVRPLFEAFAKGFGLPMQADSYKLLDPSEFDLLLSGDPVLDWALLPGVTTYEGYTAESQAIVWFWEIFWNMSEEEKCHFLKFVTGTDRAPYGGVGKMRLTIDRSGNVSHLPVSHTCFNCLSLPEYLDKESMERKLKLAIQFTEGFGFK
jgi:ubiquitin-protein ligase E3 A